MAVIGDINKLKILRKTDIGYMLDSELGEILIHNNEAYGETLVPDDHVSVFLYLDQQKRLAATLAKPFATVNHAGLLEVVSVNNNLGVFLDMGINKDLLLSMDDLPTNKALWPKTGDKLYAKVVHKNRLTARLQYGDRYENEDFEIGTTIKAYVNKMGVAGLNLVTESFHDVFVHKSMFREKYRLGQLVEVRITHFSENGYSGSLMPQKEVLRLDDAEIILDFLKENGSLPLTSKSTADEIIRFFKMSRKAFKRALGHLYKENLVKFDEDNTYLVGERNAK